MRRIFAIIALLLAALGPAGAQNNFTAPATPEFPALSGMQKTEKRTGVLIFAAVAERYVEIIAYAGINAKVTQDVRDAAVASLVSAIKDDRPGDGFVAAIEQCGAVLATHFPAAPGEINVDEVQDKLVEI